MADVSAPHDFVPGQLGGCMVCDKHITDPLHFRKFDADKLRFDLMPPKALESIVRVLTFGAKKYAPGNWIKAPTWSRYYAALQRHMHAWWAGEQNDPETGISHLAHAGCCLVFLMEFERLGVSEDDRPKQTPMASTRQHYADKLPEERVAVLEAELERLREQNMIMEAELFQMRAPKVQG